MNRNEAIERALMKCNSLDMGDCVEIPLAQWEAVEEALAMPKDAERDALLERIDSILDYWQNAGLPDASVMNLLRDIRAYLGGA